MELEVNGDSMKLPDRAHVSDVLAQMGLTGRRVAVELNGEIVSRTQFEQMLLSAGDRLEVVQAIGGG